MLQHLCYCCVAVFLADAALVVVVLLVAVVASAIFVFVNNTLPPASSLMSQIYNDHKDEDGFLYVTYSGESTFGSQ